MNQKVQDSYGVMIDEDAAVMLMDDELREMLHIVHKILRRAY